MPALDDLRWVEPWEPVSSESARKLEAELQLETTPGHPLYGVEARAFGRCGHRDDVAFELADGTYAVAHLTWIGGPEQRPEFPITDLYPSVAALQARFDEDHGEYAL